MDLPMHPLNVDGRKEEIKTSGNRIEARNNRPEGGYEMIKDT